MIHQFHIWISQTEFVQVESIVLRPLLDDLEDVFVLRVVGDGLENRQGLNQMIGRFLVGDDHLEHPDDGSPEGIVILLIIIDLLERLKGLERIEELPHLIAVIPDDLENIEGVGGGLHGQIDVPGGLGLAIHNVGPDEPPQEDILAPVPVVADEEEGLLGFFEIAGVGTGEGVVPVEVVIRLEVVADGLQVHQHVVELLQQEEAARHALAARDRVAFGRGGPHQLEQLLRCFDVLPGVLLLPVHGVHHSLQDVLSGGRGLDVFDQVEGLSHLLFLEVVNHQIELSLWEDVDQRRQSLHCVLAVPENNEVMSEEIALLENVIPFEELLDGLENLLRILTRIELVVVAGFEVGGVDALWVEVQVSGKNLH